MKPTVASVLASTIDAYWNCRDLSWKTNHEETIGQIARDLLPSGSGIDGGTGFVFGASNGKRLVLSTQYHHMNANGFYDGWTKHIVYVTPTFHGFELRITGRDRNDVKDYLYQTFQLDLSAEVEFDSALQRWVLKREVCGDEETPAVREEITSTVP